MAAGRNRNPGQHGPVHPGAETEEINFLKNFNICAGGLRKCFPSDGTTLRNSRKNRADRADQKMFFGGEVPDREMVYLPF